MGLCQHQPASLLFRRVKTLGYEVAEQLGWQLPDHIVALASGSCSPKIYKGFQEFIQVGLVADKSSFSGAQAEGCSPLLKPSEKVAT